MRKPKMIADYFIYNAELSGLSNGVNAFVPRSAITIPPGKYFIITGGDYYVDASSKPTYAFIIHRLYQNGAQLTSSNVGIAPYNATDYAGTTVIGEYVEVTDYTEFSIYAYINTDGGTVTSYGFDNGYILAYRLD